MNQTYLRRIYWRLTGAIMLAVVLALALNSYLSHRTFERTLSPEMAKKALTVMASVRALMLKAVDQGIEYRALHGVDATFDEAREENPEFSSLAATDARGAILYQRGNPPEGFDAHLGSAGALAVAAGASSDGSFRPMRVGAQYVVSMPVIGPDGPLGALHAGIDVGFVDDIVREMLFDVVVILIVSLFFTLELLNFIAGARLEAGLRAVAGMLERGQRGDFTIRPEGAAHPDFGGVLQKLEAAAARVNAGMLALAREIDAARLVPAHERRSGLPAAQAGLHDLQQRYRFDENRTVLADPEGRLARVRAPLFAFILAEELTRSFLPSYVNSLLVPIPGLSAQIVVGLPIVLFMLIVALGQPYLGTYCERVGHRRTMLIGAAIAVVGFGASAMAYNVLDLLLWRGLCAVGYAMVFVAAQGYVLDNTTATNRAKGFALFVGAIMVATVCGPSIGGILGDNIGHRATFLVSAVLALVSIVAIRLLPEEPVQDASAREHSGPRLRELATLLSDRRFMTLTGLAAMPAKIILTGICFYLVPLYLVSIGSTQSMAGRVLMTYAVVMVLVVPIAGAFAGTREQREWLVGAGLLVSGIGGMLMIVSSSVPWVFASVFLIGLGQSLSITAQSALVSDQCVEAIERMGDHTVYGVYRLLERIGNALGPLIAAGLVMAFGYQQSFVAIGALALACGAVFLLATRAGSNPAPATMTG